MFTKIHPAQIVPGDRIAGNTAVRFVSVNVLPEVVLVTVTNGRDTWDATLGQDLIEVVR